MLPIIIFIIAILFASIRILLTKPLSLHEMVGIFLQSILFFNIGCMSLISFYAHIFMSAETAQQIGWAPGSPFQLEIGMANFSYGILGIIFACLRPTFWIPILIGNAIFLFGAAWVHMGQIALGDIAPYNSGLFLWGGDVAIPCIWLLLALVYYKDHPIDKV